MDKPKQLSKCIPKNSIIIHPIILNRITIKDNLFFSDLYLDHSDNIIKDALPCDSVDKFNPAGDSYLNSIVSPDLSYSNVSFLKIIYNINSYDDSLIWINNNLHLQKNTIERVINCIFSVYHNDIKSNTTEFVNYFINYIYKFYPKYKSHHNINKIIKESIKNVLVSHDEDIDFIKKIIHFIKYFITKNI